MPPGARDALLKGDWPAAAASLRNMGKAAPDAVCRLAAAHVCLATNRNNEALVLFLSAEESDLAEWGKWKDGLAATPRRSVAPF